LQQHDLAAQVAVVERRISPHACHLCSGSQTNCKCTAPSAARTTVHKCSWLSCIHTTPTCWHL
jgi:hypothetical protein